MASVAMRRSPAFAGGHPPSTPPITAILVLLRPILGVVRAIPATSCLPCDPCAGGRPDADPATVHENKDLHGPPSPSAGNAHGAKVPWQECVGFATMASPTSPQRERLSCPPVPARCAAPRSLCSSPRLQ